ncbi:MAG: ferric reductase-like transmembrane domain-containing protein [Stappiaceae bacterium]
MLLAVPAFFMLNTAFTAENTRVVHQLLHPSGEFSARFMIIAMMATPLTMIFRGWRGPAWLKKNRRYFGVAAFFYAALHTIFYLMDKASLARVVDELPQIYIWTGWLAFAIFIPLAVTSFDYFVRIMGRRWKALQRWVYAAAILTLVHWAALHDWASPMGAIVHFAPLAGLEAYRIWYWYLRPNTVSVS